MIIVEHIDYAVTFTTAGIIKDAYICIQGEVIVQVGHGNYRDQCPAVKVKRVISGRGMVILPGLINGHHHFFQMMTRFLPAMQGERFFKWKELGSLYWNQLDQVDILWSSRVALAELAHSGCTTTVDFPYGLRKDVPTDNFVAAEVRAQNELGMRLHIMLGSQSIANVPDRSIEEIEESIRKFHQTGFGAMVSIGIAPHSLVSSSTEMFRDMKELSVRTGCLRHTHVAETAFERENVQHHYKMSPIEYLDSLGWLDSHTLLAHAVHVGTKDLDILAKTKAKIVHCPTSNMNLGSGIAPIYEMITREIPVGIGVDGSASSASGHVLGEIRQAMLLSRVSGMGEGLSSLQSLMMATIDGANCLSRTDIGRISEGLQADLTFFRTDQLTTQGYYYDPIVALATAWPQQASHVMVGGKFVVWDFELTTIDEERLLYEYKLRRDYFLKKL